MRSTPSIPRSAQWGGARRVQPCQSVVLGPPGRHRAGGVPRRIGDHPTGPHDRDRAPRARRVGGVAVPARVRPRLHGLPRRRPVGARQGLPHPRHPPLRRSRPLARAAGVLPAARRHPAPRRGGVDRPRGDRLALGLSALALIQVLAFVLNILPVPGLDGFGVLEPFLSYSARRVADRVRPWAPIALFVLILGVPGVASALLGIGALVFSGIGGDTDLAFTGYSE